MAKYNIPRICIGLIRSKNMLVVRLFSTTINYQKVLSTLCANDGKVLLPSTVDELFSPPLSPQDYEALKTLSSNPELGSIMGQGKALDARLDWGVGGLLNMEFANTGRKSKTLSWTGFPNCFWWIDRERGISEMYFGAPMPTGDIKTSKSFTRFEKIIYHSASR